jgi:DNA mismatch repair ATPase MutS
LASSLNYWLEGQIDRCPHVIVASHFHSLPELINDPNELVRFQTMGVSKLEDDSLEFHFNLMDGITDLSYANFTALKMGIPRTVIDRAEEVKTGENIRKYIFIIRFMFIFEPVALLPN